VRFLYGMRLVGPMVIGASGVSPLRFTLVNLLGALVWALAFASAGYWAGQFFESLLGNLKPYRLPIALGVVALAVVIALVRHMRQRAKLRHGM
jgi:membrane protein DedA with SNARE-associated domain